MKRLRCAIYTRKSSEEGLEQNFNSLHAQRESCEAFVLSQAGEGWEALSEIFEDGGYSGGNMERPGLAHLLDEVARGRIDTVVVYKVDRLTRSLADFAKIVEAFDGHGVSFVSVTQAFNTTTSMGRLTLNVLLSFAQFEREVTSERIRDKIAASKAKGLRMGGRPPLGYDVKELRLVINEAEAEQVGRIFRRYLEVESVDALVDEMAKAGATGKLWVSRRGELTGGQPVGRGALRFLLSNPVYRGANRHKALLHEGAHPAIIDHELWQAVQAKLASGNGARPDTPKLGEGALLAGLLFDDTGHHMGVVHTTKGARRYRYYRSLRRPGEEDRPLGSLPRVAAGVIDQFIVTQVESRLSRSWRPGEDERFRVQAALLKVAIGAEEVRLTIRSDCLGPAISENADIRQADEGVEFRLPILLKHRQGAVLIGVEGETRSPRIQIDKALVRAVVLARQWAKDLCGGRFGSIKQLARESGLCEHYTMRLAPLAFLAPDLVAMILEGRQPAVLTLKALTAGPLPMDWAEQRDLVRALALGQAAAHKAADRDQPARRRRAA